MLALFFLHPVLGLIVTTSVAATWTLSKWMSQSIPHTQLSVQDAQHRFEEVAEEALLAPEILRSQNAHQHLSDKLSERLIQLHKRMDGLDSQLRRLGSLNHLTLAAQAVAITAIGSVLVFRGELSLGALIGANLLAARALTPLSRFILASEQFYKLETAVMLFQRLSALPEASDRTATLASSNSELSVEGLTYRFPRRSVDVFEPISFHLVGPEIVVITGPNGSGKTTLIQLLTGLRIPTEGRVLLQGVELKQLSGTWWESQFLYVPQDDRLLNGTVYSSLTQGIPDVDDVVLSKTLEQVSLKAWIDQNPDGLARVLRNFGGDLPPGIRKKISLTRALISNAPVLFLDEPTQSLDQQGKLGLLAALNERFQKGKTLVLCSDDPEVICGATLLIDLTDRMAPMVSRRHLGSYRTNQSLSS